MSWDSWNPFVFRTVPAILFCVIQCSFYNERNEM